MTWAERGCTSIDAEQARLRDEPRSRVTFDIEPVGGSVRLTVTHDRFEPGSTVRSMVSQGRPQLISSLETLLETGEVLPEAESPAPAPAGGIPNGS